MENLPFDSQYYGNTMLYNMLATTIAGILVASFTSNLTYVVKLIFNYILGIRFNFLFKTKDISTVTANSISIENQYGIVHKSSNTYKAIIYKLYTKGINMKSLKEQNVILETFYRNPDNYNNKIYNYDIDHSDVIIVSIKHDIRLKSLTNEKNINNDNIAYSTTHRNLQIYSSKLTIKELVKKIKKWELQYSNYLKQYVDDGKIYYYSLCYATDTTPKNNDDKAKSKTVINWRSNVLKSYKTFDNIFFTDKNNLLNKLKYFLDNEHIYKKRGIPYNLGLLFYGVPGCGKTSCVKAIANLTNRHVFEISLNKIKTCGDFIDIMTSEFVNNIYIPIDKRIILIEDIDCMIDIVMDRKQKDTEKEIEKTMVEKMDTESIMKMMLLADHSQSNNHRDYKNDDKLTLACILNTIDGALEQYGRILIITTNYANKLDKALIRPGRIDIQINFTLCTNLMIREMIEFYFETKLPKNVIFPDNKYTPAEIVNICIDSTNTLDKIIKQLRNK